MDDKLLLTFMDEVTNHTNRVCDYISRVCFKLCQRSYTHDDSKLQQPEMAIFAKYMPLLKKTTFGSEEYHKYRLEMADALEHHYAHNRHHPEHFKDGMRDMTLIDLIEMLCDWKSASVQHDDGGDVRRSLEVNQDRFGYGDELKQIMLNTFNELFPEEEENGHD